MSATHDEMRNSLARPGPDTPKAATVRRWCLELLEFITTLTTERDALRMEVETHQEARMSWQAEVDHINGLNETLRAEVERLRNNNDQEKRIASLEARTVKLLERIEWLERSTKHTWRVK